MKIYRRLLFFETVKDGDEVLNQNKFKTWTKFHGYTGSKVNTCFGCVTGLPRKFRRQILGGRDDKL